MATALSPCGLPLWRCGVTGRCFVPGRLWVFRSCRAVEADFVIFGGERETTWADCQGEPVGWLSLENIRCGASVGEGVSRLARMVAE